MDDSGVCDVNQNSKLVGMTSPTTTTTIGDVHRDGDVTLADRKCSAPGDGEMNGDLCVTTESLKGLHFLDHDRGDDTSTTSSGVSSGGSGTLSVGSSSATTSPDKEKKKFDVSLNSWNIWQEDAEYAPPSESDDDDEGISSSGLRRFKSLDYSTDTATKKKRFSGFLRRFSLRDSHEVSAPKRETFEMKPKPKEIVVDTLPQYFVVKYLGYRRGTGLYGLKHIRRPVDEMIAAVGNLRRGEELTLAQIHITKKGVHLSTHSDNRGAGLTPEFVPLEFISYGVQDLVHTRVFCLLLVRTLSRHAKKIECHAFVCNCSATAKKMALSVGLAFQKYAASLKGQPHKFEVDLNKHVKKDTPRDPEPSDA